MRSSLAARLLCDARPWMFTAMALVAAYAVAGCGKKEFPRPPQMVRPRVIDDLVAKPVDDGIRLTWTRPTTTVDGRDMPDLDGIMISRATEAPRGTPQKEVIFEHIATIHLDDRTRFDKVRRMSFHDRNVVRDQAYSYRVTAFTLDRYFSVPSPVARARWSGPPRAADLDE